MIPTTLMFTFLAGIAFGTVATLYLSYKLYTKFLKSTPSQLLFFPDEKVPCLSLTGLNPRRCRNRSCNYLHETDSGNSLLKIIETLRGAKHIELCMYRFTLRQIGDLLVAKHDREGTKIRIITDNAPEPVDNNQIPRLREAGIEVREKDASVDERLRPLMHNKFVIVDDTCCLMGSFNWTYAAVTKNHEVVLKSHEPHIVKELKEKFEQMWKELAKVPNAN